MLLKGIHIDVWEMSLDSTERVSILFSAFSLDFNIILMGKNAYETNVSLLILEYRCDHVVTLSAGGDSVLPQPKHL